MIILVLSFYFLCDKKIEDIKTKLELKEKEIIFLKELHKEEINKYQNQINTLKELHKEEIDKYLSQGEKDPYLHIKERKRTMIIQRDKNFFGGKIALRS